MLKSIKAPLTGIVIEVAVNVDQQVGKGDLLVLMESMKVQLRVEAEADGIVRSITAKVDDTVQRDSELVSLEGSEMRNPRVASSRSGSTVSPNRHSLIQEFSQRRNLSLDSHRMEAAAKRHSKGYQTARENLAKLCDPASFQEYGQFAVAAQRQRHDYQTLKTSSAADGIITGIGQVNGQSVALVVNDYSVMAGTQGFFHHQKLDRILAVAREKKLPVIMYTEGGGGRPGDTDVTVVNSGLQCTSFGTWAGLSGLVPRISVANGYNFAGNAALFGAADITIATKRSWIGMAGPAMIEGGGLGTFKPTDIGPIEVQSSNGTVDIVADDEAQAAEVAVKVLSYFQTVEPSWQVQDQVQLQSALPENRRQTYKVRSIIEQLFDQSSFIELRQNYGPSIVIGLARIEGKSVGIMANDCTSLGGAIDVNAGDKAARFMQLCDQFQLPIISFCDTPGFMVGPEHETQGAVRRLAEMFRVGAQISTPFYAVILRKCYGLGAQAMLGGSTHRPLTTLAWPTGEFGPMGLEGAVRLGFSKELAAIADPEQQKALFEKLLAQQYEKGQATEVASVLEIDAVIDPADTRAALATLLA
ncbi:MAG: acetyl-CoA carboxylase carboxyltransferase component [Arenicella sp.]|jgi:acetyl-CoA carboxylase carboxyltransferase component